MQRKSLSSCVVHRQAFKMLTIAVMVASLVVLRSYHRATSLMQQRFWNGYRALDRRYGNRKSFKPLQYVKMMKFSFQNANRSGTSVIIVALLLNSTANLSAMYISQPRSKYRISLSSGSNLDDTVDRYISDVQSGPFINNISANLGIAHTCMTYLMLTCFDPNFSEAEMTSAILNGHYVLQPYATSHWLEHVKAAVQRGMPTSEFEQLCQKIREFLSRRTNSTFRRRLAECKDEKSKKQFEKEQPSIYQGLTHFEHGQAYIYKWLGYINSTMTLEVPEETRKDLSKFLMVSLR